jgi:hypothetical protein
VKDIWTIQSLHFSSNLLDNPVLSAAQMQGRIIGAIAGIAGLVLGAVGMWFFRRQPGSATQMISESDDKTE